MTNYCKQQNRPKTFTNTTLAEQQRSKMIASSNLSYARELFGSPYQSNSPTEPRIRNIILVYFSLVFS